MGGSVGCGTGFLVRVGAGGTGVLVDCGSGVLVPVGLDVLVGMIRVEVGRGVLSFEPLPNTGFQIPQSVIGQKVETDFRIDTSV